MPTNDLFRIFIQPLNELKIQYAVTGSVAAMAYGKPRFTHDIDIVILLSMADIKRFLKVFPPDEFYVPPQEELQAAIRLQTGGHFNLIHQETAFKADIYLVGRDPLLSWAVKNVRIISLGPDLKLPLAPPEYVILKKLEYFRDGQSLKHLDDVRAMLEVSVNEIDFDVLQNFVRDQGLTTEWELVREGLER